MNGLRVFSEKSTVDRRSQLLALGVLCKLLQKIESADVVRNGNSLVVHYETSSKLLLNV